MEIAASAKNAPALKVRGYWRTVGHRLRHDYVTLFFALVILFIALSAIFAPLLAPFDPLKTSMAYRLKPIGYRSFLLGTDELGRDMLSRLVYGGRMSLLMGLTPVVLATIIGGTLGVVAGFVGGGINMLIMRAIDIFYAFPSVLLAVAISGTMGGGMSNGLIALTLVFIPPLCRIAETAATQVRGLDFVEAARASGAPTRSIIVHHVLGPTSAPCRGWRSSSRRSPSTSSATGCDRPWTCAYEADRKRGSSYGRFDAGPPKARHRAARRCARSRRQNSTNARCQWSQEALSRPRRPIQSAHRQRACCRRCVVRGAQGRDARYCRGIGVR
jgi:peptide/nickel transport system permease protein